MQQLEAFLRESNAIEGIHREPYLAEVAAADHFMRLPGLGLQDVNDIQSAFAPGHKLRERIGLDVRVGTYIAPRGGPEVRDCLCGILLEMQAERAPWKTHVAFEMLHPYTDGNGRTGRILWAWHMQRLGRDPFALSFLHRFYYQTLEAQG